MEILKQALTLIAEAIAVSSAMIISLLIISSPIIKKTQKRKYRKYYKPRKRKLTPEEKGILGENSVSVALGGTIPKKQYLINDIILRDENGKTSQIDHILINPNGIFVIETKNYHGYIHGKIFERYWVQVLNRETQNTFYNPIWQNKTHIKILKKLTKTSLPIYSVIIFVNGNINKISEGCVFDLNGAVKYINANKNERISEENMKYVYDKICFLAKTKSATLTEHVTNVKKIK